MGAQGALLAGPGRGRGAAGRRPGQGPAANRQLRRAATASARPKAAPQRCGAGSGGPPLSTVRRKGRLAAPGPAPPPSPSSPGPAQPLTGGSSRPHSAAHSSPAALIFLGRCRGLAAPPAPGAASLPLLSPAAAGGCSRRPERRGPCVRPAGPGLGAALPLEVRGCPRAPSAREGSEGAVERSRRCPPPFWVVVGRSALLRARSSWFLPSGSEVLGFGYLPRPS